MKNKDFVIGIIFFFLIAGLLIILLFNDDTIEINDPSSSENSSSKIDNPEYESQQIIREKKNEERKTLSAVDNYQDFFTINYYINDVYQKLDSSDFDSLFSILDKDYRTLNNVNKNNIRDLITKNIEVSYVTHHIYMKGKDNIIYYFIDGEEQYSDYISGHGDLSVKDNVYYLLTLDEDTNYYNIRPLKVDNLFNYAQSFSLNNNSKVTGKNSLIQKNFSDEIISLTYLSYFQTMLITSPEKAYNMLNDASRSKFSGYDDFVSKINTLVKDYPVSILNFSAKGENGKRYYSVICTNNKVINFEEKGIMDFKVIL